MARERDEGKRKGILTEATRLFAEKGFHATSVADVVARLDIPVGSVYTYFKNKDDILRLAIEEGWSEFYDALSAACAAASGPVERLHILVNRFLPELLDKTDFISIILTEGLRFTDFKGKIEAMAELIGGILGDLGRERGVSLSLSPRQYQTALSVFFLGMLDTVRLAKLGGLPLSERDVLSFIRAMIHNSFGVNLDALTAG